MAIETLMHALLLGAQDQGSKPAFTFLNGSPNSDVTLDRSELLRASLGVARQLEERGLSGQRVLILCPPGLEFVVSFFGVLFAAATAVPAFPPVGYSSRSALPRLLAIASDCQAQGILTHGLPPGSIERIPQLSALQHIAVDLEAALQAGASTTGGELAAPSEIALLQYTSGSTATPKGVMVSHQNLVANVRVIERALPEDSRQAGVVASWLPPYHDMGLIGAILAPAYLGMHSVLMSPLHFLQQPARWLWAISRYRATYTAAPNFAFDLCAIKCTAEQRAGLDLSSCRAVFCGAEPVRDQSLRRFVEAFGSAGFRAESLVPCYGLAESTLMVSGNKPQAEYRSMCVDTALLGLNRIQSSAAADATTLVSSGTFETEVCITDPHTRYRLAEGQVGEIWLKSPSVAQGYWGRPKETREIFNASLSDADSGPYLRTGDLGFIDNGELFVTGRMKSLIIIRGRNHYPQDIETTVESAHPAIGPGHVAAFSYERDGEELLGILVNLKRSEGCTPELLPQIRQSIERAVMAAHQVTVAGLHFQWSKPLPKTSSGKLQRHICKAQYLENDHVSI